MRIGPVLCVIAAAALASCGRTPLLADYATEGGGDDEGDTRNNTGDDESDSRGSDSRGSDSRGSDSDTRGSESGFDTDTGNDSESGGDTDTSDSDSGDPGLTCRDIVECSLGCLAGLDLQCIQECGNGADPAATEAATNLVLCAAGVCFQSGECTFPPTSMECVTCIGVKLFAPEPTGCEAEAAACDGP